MREVRDHELGRERGSVLQRILQPWPDPRPGADHAAADRDPLRVHQDGQVHEVKGELVGKVVDQAVEPAVRAGRGEDVGGGEWPAGPYPARLPMPAAFGPFTVGGPLGQRLAADHVLEQRALVERPADVGHRAEVVADLPGRAVDPGHDLAADHDGGGQPGAQVQVDGGIAAGQRAPADLGLSGRLRVGGHADLGPGERGAQLAAHGQAVPAIDGRGQLHPVLERDPEGGYAHGDELAARCRGAQQVARDLDPAAEAGLGPEGAVAGHGGRCQLLPGQVAYGGSDLRATVVEPEHDGRNCHGCPPVHLDVMPTYHQDS